MNIFSPRSVFGAKQMLAILSESRQNQFFPDEFLGTLRQMISDDSSCPVHSNFQQLSRVSLRELNSSLILVDTFTSTLVKKFLGKEFVPRFQQYSLTIISAWSLTLSSMCERVTVVTLSVCQSVCHFFILEKAPFSGLKLASVHSR